jgi:outer membrane protein TolC
VAQEQYKLAQDQLRHAQNAVKAGARPQIEIVRAEAGLSSRLEAVINTETDVKDLERELRRIMNRDDLPLDADMSIHTESEPHPLGLDLDQQTLVALALENRMEMIELEQQLEINALEVELAQNHTRPDITLSGTYAWHAQGAGFSDSIGDLAHASYDDMSLGLSARIPLGNQVARAGLQRARLTQLQNKARHHNLEQSIRQDVLEAVNDLNRNWRRILITKLGVESAYREYKVEQSQFQLGRRFSTDVLLAADRYANAQLRQIQAFAEYEIAQVNLARATGTLLGYGKVTLNPTPINKS